MIGTQQTQDTNVMPKDQLLAYFKILGAEKLSLRLSAPVESITKGEIEKQCDGLIAEARKTEGFVDFMQPRITSVDDRWSVETQFTTAPGKATLVHDRVLAEVNQLGYQVTLDTI